MHPKFSGRDRGDLLLRPEVVHSQPPAVMAGLVPANHADGRKATIS